MTARGNGLRASAYAVLVEIEESLGDALLLALAERRIAAYVVPVAGPGGSTRLILHVDALRRIPAGVVLAGLTPALAGELPAESESAPESVAELSAPADPSAALSDDAAFAELIAGYDRVVTGRPWPEAEDLPERLSPGPGSFGPPPLVDRRKPALPATGRHLDPIGAEHYEPPLLPRLDPPPPVARWALLALGLGVALLLLPTFFAFEHRTSLDIAGVICVVFSAAVLLSRLRDRSPDDPDDGAVV